jgi:CubicO group peptidase (beta-lactamase class C family)
VSLDDPVTNYLPALEGAGDVRLRHLLTHTSGLGDAVDYLETDGAPPEGHFTFDELIFLSRLKGRAFKPGERFAYNNFGYDVLGAVIEAASGEPRDEFVRKRILAPLKMSDVYFGANGDWPVDNAARGFYPANGAPMEMTGPRDLSWASSAGDMIENADTLMVWLKALGEKRNAAGLTLGDFTESRVDSSAHSADMPEYGLGVMGRRFAGRMSWGHGGFIHGYISYVGVDAQNGVRFVLLTSTNGDPNIPPSRLLGGVSSVIGTALQMTDFAIETGVLEP